MAARISKAKENLIALLYGRMSAREVALEVGVSRHTAIRVLRESGVDVSLKANRAVGEKTLEKLRPFVGSSLSISEIARRVAVSRSSCSRGLLRLGHKGVPRNEAAIKNQRRTVERLLRKTREALRPYVGIGQSYAAISRETGLQPATVSKHLRELGNEQDVSAHEQVGSKAKIAAALKGLREKRVERRRRLIPQIVALKESGWGDSAIGRQVGLSTVTVSRWLAARGRALNA